MLDALRSPKALAKRLVTDVPPLVQLTAVLLLFLLNDLHTFARFFSLFCACALPLALLVLLLDKRLLQTDRVVSDEVLAATVVIAALITTLAFVATTLAAQSAIDAVQLLLSFSTWMRDVSTDAAAPVRELARRGMDFGRAGLENLHADDHAWAPAAHHLIHQIDTNSNNGTLVVMSTFGKLKECYPRAAWVAAWVGVAEDVARLVLWAGTVVATTQDGGAASPADSSSTASAFAAVAGRYGLTEVTPVQLEALGWREEAMRIARELESPHELLRWLSEGAWPAVQSTLFGSRGEREIPFDVLRLHLTAGDPLRS